MVAPGNMGVVGNKTIIAKGLLNTD